MKQEVSKPNLTDPMEIRHALERKLGGVGAITIFANAHGYSVGYISQTMAGDRSNPKVLEAIASCLGQPVHGVQPRAKKTMQAS